MSSTEDQQSFQIRREVVGNIPESLSHGKALALSDPFRVLILDTMGSSESCYYDLPSHQVFRREHYPFGRSSENVTLLRDRFVLTEAGGGFKCYDTATKQSRFLPRSNFTSRVISSAIAPSRYGFYVIGGKDRNNNSLKNNFEYLPFTNVHPSAATTDCWEHRPPIVIPRHSATATSIGSQIFLIGGYFWNRTSCRYQACRQTEIFDGAHWQLGPELHHARQNPSVVIIQERIVVVLGGTNSIGEVVLEVEVWDLRTRGFVVWGSLGEGEVDYSAVGQGSDIFIFGGSHVEKLCLNFADFDQEALETAILFGQLPDEEVSGGRISPDAETIPAIIPPLEPSSPRSGESYQVSRKPITHGLELPSKYLPAPPLRPELPISGQTIVDRYHGLQGYCDDLNKLHDDYQSTLEGTRHLVAQAYDRAKDRALQEINEREDLWTRDHNRLLLQARGEANRLLPFIEREDRLVGHLEQDPDDDGIPRQLVCPITLNLMKDPVVAADGNTYEREALEQWFCGGKTTSPLTGAKLSSRNYFPVYTLKSLCRQFEAKHCRDSSNRGTKATKAHGPGWDDEDDVMLLEGRSPSGFMSL